MKRCPFCAEEIQDAAIVCKHCHRDLSGRPKVVTVHQADWVSTTAKWGVGILLGLILFGMIMSTFSDNTDAPASTPLVAAGRRFISCAGGDTNLLQATFNSNVSELAMLDITFKGKPTPLIADATLRRCLDAAAQAFPIERSMMLTAWMGMGTATEDDDRMITLPDGSDHLMYDPKTKATITYRQYEDSKKR